MPPPQDLSIPLVPFQGDEKERRAFAFFCDRTAKCFQSEFSSFYLLRAAVEEPAIRHAILALGGIHEFCELEKERLNGNSLTDSFSERYGRAITLLTSPSQMSPKQLNEIFLSSCILFACFESLRGHIKSAITHVRCGLKLLHQTETIDSPASFVYVPQKIIKSLFTRLDSQMMELGGSLLLAMLRETKRPSLPFSALQDPETFKNLDGAYESFDIFLNRTLHVHRTFEMLLADPRGFSDPETLLLEIETERWKCLLYIDRWSLAFNHHFMAHWPQPKQYSDYNIYALQIWRLLAKTLHSVNLANGEEDWDRFQPEFNSIITLAESLVGNSYTKNKSSQGIPSFSFHLGIVVPLLFTSIRCHDPIIRQRAIQILSSSRRFEGMWDSYVAAKVAKYVIDAEEKSAWQRLPEIETCHRHDFSSQRVRPLRVKNVLVVYDDSTLPQIELNWAA